MPAIINKRYYKYALIAFVVLLLMFVYTVHQQSLLSIAPGHGVSLTVQSDCTNLFYNHTEQGWLNPGESTVLIFLVGSGSHIWSYFEHSISFTGPDYGDYTVRGCEGNSTIIIRNAGETILSCIDSGEMSTIGTGTTFLMFPGSSSITITNNFDCPIYFSIHITVRGCSTGSGDNIPSVPDQPGVPNNP